jgi:hypothetical protein
MLKYMDDVEIGKVKISANAKKSLEQSIRIWESDLKAAIDCYLYGSRSSLSVGGTGFNAVTRQSFEVIYPQEKQPVEEKKGLFGLGGK